jgi:hypothetical protein
VQNLTNDNNSRITPLKLRSDIERWLDGLIGVYLLPFNYPPEDVWGLGLEVNGSSTRAVSAIAVLPDNKYGYAYPPKDVQVSGLEVVILRLVVNSKKLLGRDLYKRYPTEIYLKLWDNSGNLIKATDKLIDGLNADGYEFQAPQAIPADEGSIGQVKVLVFDSFVQVN